MREILTCKWEKPSIYRTGVGSKKWSTGCHRGEIWYVSVVEIGNHDGQYTEATLSQNKIYIYICIYIYIAIKLKNSQNFNQKIEKKYLFVYLHIHFIHKKYLHISSIKLKDHTNFNQKIVTFSTIVLLKKNICTIIYLYKKFTKFSFMFSIIEKIFIIKYKNKYRKEFPTLINKY